MTVKVYGKAAQAIATKQIDLINDDFKVMLVTSAYVPNNDNHGTKANVTGEASGAGYTSGGKSLTGKTLTQNAADNLWTWDADNLAWTAVTVTFRYAVIYDDSVASKPLIAYVDFGSNQSASSQDLTIKWEYVYQDEISGGITTSNGILGLGY